MPTIAGELGDLPLDALIGKPLEAVIKAQAAAAMTSTRFIKEVGLQAPDGDEDENTVYQVNSVKFQYTKKVVDNQGNVSDQNVTLNVPLLSIVPIPYIRIKDMTIDLNVTITATEITQQTELKMGGGSIGGFWAFIGGRLYGRYRNKRTTRSQIDRSAELDITVNAVQDEIPEGLRIVLTLLNEAITGQQQQPS